MKLERVGDREVDLEGTGRGAVAMGVYSGSQGRAGREGVAEDELYLRRGGRGGGGLYCVKGGSEGTWRGKGGPERERWRRGASLSILRVSFVWGGREEGGGGGC